MVVCRNAERKNVEAKNIEKYRCRKVEFSKMTEYESSNLHHPHFCF